MGTKHPLLRLRFNLEGYHQCQLNNYKILYKCKPQQTCIVTAESNIKVMRLVYSGVLKDDFRFLLVESLLSLLRHPEDGLKSVFSLQIIFALKPKPSTINLLD